MNPDQELGRYLLERRQALAVSRRALGAAIGRDRSYVERIERGQTLSPRYLPAIAAALQCSVNELIYPMGNTEKLP